MVNGFSITGKKHSANQDGFIIKDDIKCYVVADGMGGHAAGDIAAKMATDIISEKLKRFSSDEIVDVIAQANRCILEKSKQDIKLEGMGTTIVLCMIKENEAIIAHVGDSRAYVISDGKIKHITRDHSYVQQLVDNGEITAQEAKTHSMKNIITNAVGAQELVDVEIDRLNLGKNSVILLCTDGVSNVMTDEDLAALTLAPGDNPAKILCEKAQELGSSDDVTAIVIDLRGDIL